MMRIVSDTLSPLDAEEDAASEKPMTRPPSTRITERKGIPMRHLMSPLDFTPKELDQLFDLANDIERSPSKYWDTGCSVKLRMLLRPVMHSLAVILQPP